MIYCLNPQGSGQLISQLLRIMKNPIRDSVSLRLTSQGVALMEIRFQVFSGSWTSCPDISASLSDLTDPRNGVLDMAQVLFRNESGQLTNIDLLTGQTVWNVSFPLRILVFITTPLGLGMLLTVLTLVQVIRCLD
jgi:hypothetical protein